MRIFKSKEIQDSVKSYRRQILVGRGLDLGFGVVGDSEAGEARQYLMEQGY